jgi:hypothetical protein
MGTSFLLKEIKYIKAQYGSSYSTGMLEIALKNAENKYKSALKVYNDEITILENEIKLLNKELSKPNIDNILSLVMERCSISSKETYEYYYKYSKYLT